MCETFQEVLMRRLIRGVLASVLVFACLVAYGDVVEESHDRQVLVALYLATGGESWNRNKGWLSDAPIDDWDGVAAESGRVTALYLSGMNLTGSIPKILGRLTELERLDLGSNSLSDPLPDLSNLKELRTLLLNDNQFTGAIPKWIGNLESLQSLDMSTNQLTGSIPKELGRLSSLTNLDLYDNKLTGPLPTSMAGLTNLSYLDLRWNLLSSPMPDLSKLEQLRYFMLSANQFNEEIPKWFGRLGELTRLDLSHNKFRGKVPSELGMALKLESLVLNDNNIEGPLPPEIGNSPRLERLDVANNRLSGLIPVELRQLSSLVHLNLSNNDLSGPLPPSLSELTSLCYLDLRWNSLSSPLPDLSGIETLETLLLTDNQFNGEIPKWIGSVGSLGRLDLSHNQFGGNIPSELGMLHDLESLALHHNKLEGELPAELGSMQELRRMILSWNHLTGSVPEELASLIFLRHLNLSNNSLSGGIPEWISTSETLEWVDLRRNSLLQGAETFRVALPDYYEFWTLPRTANGAQSDLNSSQRPESMHTIAMEMWAQTSEVIENSQIRAFVFESLRLFDVRDDQLHTSHDQLPEYIRLGNLRGIVSTINLHLREGALRVSNPNDLERTFKAVEGKTPGLKTVDLFDTSRVLESRCWESEMFIACGEELSGIHAVAGDFFLPLSSNYEGLRYR